MTKRDTLALLQFHNYSESDREQLLTGLATNNVEQFLPILNAVNWTPDVVASFQDSVLKPPQLYFCYSDIEVSCQTIV